MANHKRGRPKNGRAGCLLCKPWKVNGVSTDSTEGEAFSDHKRRHLAGEEVREQQDDDRVAASKPQALGMAGKSHPQASLEAATLREPQDDSGPEK